MMMVVEVLWLCWVGEVDGKKEEKSMAMMWSGKGKRENLALALAQLLPQGLHAQRRDVPLSRGWDRAFRDHDALHKHGLDSVNKRQ